MLDVKLGKVGLLALALAACSSPGPVQGEGEGELTGAPAPGGLTSSEGTGSPSAGPQGPSSLPSSTPTAPEVPEPMDVVLDDFDDNDGRFASMSSSGAAFSGAWRTYSDGTSTVTPPADAPIVPVDGAIHVAGSNFSTWGVGLSADLDTSAGARRPVDLSGYRGLKIRAQGSGSIDVELVLPATTGTAEVGGTCSAGQACFGHYAATLPLSEDDSEQTLAFSAFRQPDWATPSPLDLSHVLAINFLSRVSSGPVSIDLSLDAVSLAAPLAPATGGGAGNGGVATVNDGTNPFAGRTLHADGGAALGAYNGASGADRDLLGKVAFNPAAYWLVGGDPGRAGSIVEGAGSDLAVLVVYDIPNRDCNGESAGGASSASEYQGYIDGMSSSLQGKEAAVILEPDALALSCGASTESLISYAVNSLRQNPGIAVYIDGGHSNWIAADVMAGRLRSAGIEQATGFAVNVSNFQPTDALINYGRNLSGLLGGKPFVIDTSRNGQGARGDEWCNPAGAGLGEAPAAATGNDAVHAFLWVKRPGESDGACGQCAGTPAGQFCASYALELARNAAF
jgi:endoglucanase